MPIPDSSSEAIVVTGIGIIASVGRDRESVWQAVREGKSGVRRVGALRGVPAGLGLGAEVDLPGLPQGRMKVFPMSQIAAAEAIEDARLDLGAISGDRFGCFINGHMGDSRFVDLRSNMFASIFFLLLKNSDNVDTIILYYLGNECSLFQRSSTR